jgi:hypothetical protein
VEKRFNAEEFAVWKKPDSRTPRKGDEMSLVELTQGETPTIPSRKKHHYIPVFYLKRWVEPDGRLCEFSRPYKTPECVIDPDVKSIPVKPRRTYPDGTGYIKNLYTFSALRPELANYLEDHFFLRVDDQAAIVMQRLLRGDVEFDNPSKSAWARFLMSMFYRSPEGSTFTFNSRIEPYQDPNLWHRLEYAYAFANKSVKDDPNFKEGSKDLKITAAVGGIGCAAGVIIGGTAGTAAGGAPALPGAGAGCLLLGTKAIEVLGAAQFGIAVADGVADAVQKNYGSGVRKTVTAVVAQVADSPTRAMPITASGKVVGSWGTYFMYGFYNEPTEGMRENG